MPNPKQLPNSRQQTAGSFARTFGNWVIGICLDFGACDLEFSAVILLDIRNDPGYYPALSLLAIERDGGVA
jgi:hypothetical protein